MLMPRGVARPEFMVVMWESCCLCGKNDKCILGNTAFTVSEACSLKAYDLFVSHELLILKSCLFAWLLLCKRLLLLTEMAVLSPRLWSRDEAEYSQECEPINKMWLKDSPLRSRKRKMRKILTGTYDSREKGEKSVAGTRFGWMG